MASVKTYEELISWQKARALVSRIYLLTNETNFSKDLGLKDQIRRAAVSIASNIAEGFERQTNKEFIQFLFIAKGSAGELRTQIYLAHDLSYINQENLEALLVECNAVSSLIGGLISYLRTTINK